MVILGLVGENSLSLNRVVGFLFSLVFLLLKAGLVLSATREWCLPDLEDLLLLLLVLLAEVEADEAPTILLESRFRLHVHLPKHDSRGSRVLEKLLVSSV